MSWLSDILWRKYVRRFSRPEQQARNRKYINRALSAYGYGNSANPDISGESFLVGKVLPALGPKVVLDIGANIGDYSRLVLETLPEARVFSFEPLRESLTTLERLSSEFGDRAVAVGLGVGNKVQDLEIHFDPGATTHASFSPEAADVPYVSNAETRTISVTTLDAFAESHLDGQTVDFIKIDTEGFEAEVLQGAQDMLVRHRPMAVQIEFNWHHMFRSHSLHYLSRYLNGYELFQLVPGGMARRDAKDPLSNLFAFSNFVFLRADLVEPLERAGFRF